MNWLPALLLGATLLRAGDLEQMYGIPEDAPPATLPFTMGLSLSQNGDDSLNAYELSLSYLRDLPLGALSLEWGAGAELIQYGREPEERFAQASFPLSLVYGGAALSWTPWYSLGLDSSEDTYGWDLSLDQGWAPFRQASAHLGAWSQWTSENPQTYGLYASGSYEWNTPHTWHGPSTALRVEYDGDGQPQVKGRGGKPMAANLDYFLDAIYQVGWQPGFANTALQMDWGIAYSLVSAELEPWASVETTLRW